MSFHEFEPRSELQLWGGLDMVVDRFDEINPMIEGIFDFREISLLYGASGCGKTFLALDLALHVAFNRPWRGCPVTGGGVLYCAVEGAAGLSRRVKAIVDKFDARGAQAVYPFDVSTTPPQLLLKSGQNQFLELISDFERLHGESPSLIIIDTLNGAFGPGDENSASDLGQIMNVLKAVAKEHFAAVMVLHHPGKDASKGPRGSSALPAGFDNIMWLARLGKGDKRRLTVKQRRDEPADITFEFSLKPVELVSDFDSMAVIRTLRVE